MLNQCTKSSNSITIFNYKIYKPYFMVLTFCSDMQFSTRDSDNDINPDGSCAQQFKGAWWYSYCHHSNLNGLYLNGSHSSMADGVNWIPFKGYYYSLKRTEMKVKQISVVVSFLFFSFLFWFHEETSQVQSTATTHSSYGSFSSQSPVASLFTYITKLLISLLIGLLSPVQRFT